ncbi:MAG TPA: 2-dehydro-3-deoxygalactonokinase [Ramlibacter sp.]|nr:2-dehydro-3-deoxygalactonokinase [Ramlibacter sp.]
MKELVAIDWGTSSLRAALLDAQGHALEERSFPRGILHVAPGEFPTVLEAACGDWLRGGNRLALISGMAGSRQGWAEAAYAACPAGFADVAAQLRWVQPGRVAIVPGMSCEVRDVPDVMRGEETQVFGALRLLGLDSGVFVLPGTHSKWVNVRSQRIEQFSTFMTGEFYALLREHSILARTLPGEDGSLDEPAFVRGVRYALESASLLHTAFSARTLSLFDRLAAEALPSLLSGLVIGEELRAQPLANRQGPVVLIGSAVLTQRYEIALRLLGVRARCVGSQATWRGLWAIAQTLEAQE